MADCDMARHFRQRVAKHFVDQPHAASDIHRIAIGHADAGAFLAPVLQRVQTPVGIERYIDARCIDAENPAFFMQFIVVHQFT